MADAALKVLLAEKKGSGQLTAVKCLRKTQQMVEEDIDSLATEANVFRIANAGRHPFLVNLYACFQTEVRLIHLQRF